MTARDQTIIREILDSLRVAEPTLLSEAVLHAAVCTRLENMGDPAPPRDEFDACLRLVDGMGLVHSDHNRFTNAIRRTLNAQGRIALKEMKG